MRSRKKKNHYQRKSSVKDISKLVILINYRRFFDLERETYEVQKGLQPQEDKEPILKKRRASSDLVDPSLTELQYRELNE